MTDLRLLAEEVDVSDRTLRRAVSRGTLRADRPGPRTLKLPLEERRYVRRSWPLVAALLDALRTEQNVTFALLFGSAATAADTASSDVDVLVDLRDSSLDRVVDLTIKLTAAVNRPVDLVRLQDAESDPSFLRAVVAEGRPLVDRQNQWRRLQRRQPELRHRGRRQEKERTDAPLAGIDKLLTP